jgi:hypothetical protein
LKLYKTQEEDQKELSFDEIISKRVYQMIAQAVEEYKNKTKTYPEDWPPILRPNDVSEVLGIARSSADELFNRRDFPYIHLTEYRKAIGAEALWHWVNKNWPPKRAS